MSSISRIPILVFSHVVDLTINDVEDLLNNYKQLVFKYVCLSKGLGGANPSPPLSSSQTQVHGDAETLNYHQDTSSVASNNEPHKLSGMTGDSKTVSLVDVEC
jgi:hypothetical protein